MAVVGFDDFNVVARGQGLGGHLQQLEGDVHAHAHVGANTTPVRLANWAISAFVLRKTGGANDGFHAQFSTQRQGAP